MYLIRIISASVVSGGRIRKGVLNSKSCFGPQAAFVDSFDFLDVAVLHLFCLLYVVVRDY